ncbi:MAG: hypothetical protein SV253_06080 [Halobacteria archaeon]|nr:hypothetical protein [Halobacteria archaeon]
MTSSYRRTLLVSVAFLVLLSGCLSTPQESYRLAGANATGVSLSESESELGVTVNTSLELSCPDTDFVPFVMNVRVYTHNTSYSEEKRFSLRETKEVKVSMDRNISADEVEGVLVRLQDAMAVNDSTVGKSPCTEEEFPDGDRKVQFGKEFGDNDSRVRPLTDEEAKSFDERLN